MVQECNFNPVCDIAPVEQSGFIDLAAANAASSIPAGIANQELSFNEIDDPNSIGGRPSDEFEAAQMNSVIASYKAPKKDTE